MATFAILTWVDLSKAEAKAMLNANITTCNRLTEKKVATFQSLRSDDAGKQKAINHLFHHTLQMAKTNRFSPEQASVLFAMTRRVHELSVSSPHITMASVFESFKHMLQSHNVQRPPKSDAVFSLTESTLVLDYVLSTYFRHFKLYQSTFIPQQLLVVDMQFSDAVTNDVETVEPPINSGADDPTPTPVTASSNEHSEIDDVDTTNINAASISRPEPPAALDTEAGKQLQARVESLLNAKTQAIKLTLTTQS